MSEIKAKSYTKMPVTIKAFQLTEEVAIMNLIDKLPLPFGLPNLSGQFHPEQRKVSRAYLHIDTLEGSMKAEIGDFIIKGIKGELYPCKPDIFAATYERTQPTEQEK